MTAVKPSDIPPPPADAELHVLLLAGRLMQAVRATMATEDWDGLRQSHFRLLSLVPRQGISISDLAVPMSMTKQAVGQFVTGLEQSGHVAVRSDPADRRVRLVVRTPLGDAVVRRVNTRIRRIERGWARQVGTDRYEEFKAVLRDLAVPTA
jgi:DNA-binding MarR family transcriptional regulator